MLHLEENVYLKMNMKLWMYGSVIPTGTKNCNT